MKNLKPFDLHAALSVDVDEWPALRDAIDLMAKNVRAEEI